MVPCKSTAKEVSFKWSHHRISLTDSKVRTTLHVSTTDLGGERVDHVPHKFQVRGSRRIGITDLRRELFYLNKYKTIMMK